MNSSSRLNETSSRRIKSTLSSKLSRGSTSGTATDIDPPAVASLDHSKTRSTSPMRLPSSRKHHKKSTDEDLKDKKREILYEGPLAHAEFDRLKRDNETLRKQLHDQKKVIKRQRKLVEDLQSEVSQHKAANNELQVVKSRYHQNDELLSRIETHLFCQICMDILLKPFALSPCGHILCRDCLTSWFRQAPVSAMDLDEHDRTAEELQEDPRYIMHREKTCPTCRVVVSRRPEPVFVVKSVASAIAQNKAERGAPVANSHLLDEPPNQEDPWRGLFPESDSESDVEIDAHYEGEDDEDEVDAAYIYGLVGSGESDDDDVSEFYGIHLTPPMAHALLYSESDSDVEVMEDDDEDDDDDESLDHASLQDRSLRHPRLHPMTALEEGEYHLPSWEPPRHSVSSQNLDSNERRLLSRGCSLGMVELFRLKYSHTEGIIAYTSSLHEGHFLPDDLASRHECCRVFLGWNIGLDDPDNDGYMFMKNIFRIMEHRPNSWCIQPRFGNLFDAHRLVHHDEVDYSTSDSEHFMLYAEQDDDMEW